MTRDANQIAQELERREAKPGESTWRSELQPPRYSGESKVGPVRGTLTIWQDIHRMRNDESWLIQSRDTTIDLAKPGLIVAYDAEGDAEIFAVEPGWYINFVPDRAGE